MKQKRLLLLGGSRYLLPVIERAKSLNLFTITCDYLPDNIAHKYSDLYINASITDKEEILKIARRNAIDGIMSFAADPGVITAAYVAEQLGLPFQGSYEAVTVLQNKNLFRSFLKENGFNCPFFHTICSDTIDQIDSFDIRFPVIVKPTDSAGSKGCTRVSSPLGLKDAVNYAIQFSRSNTCIIEEFLDKDCPSSDADGFSINGKMTCVSFTSQLFDSASPNPYTPTAYIMPAEMPLSAQNELNKELQRLAELLNLKNGIYNIETRLSNNGIPYIMEVSPRGGGNRLAEMLHLASGVDLITAAIKAAIGENLADEKIDAPQYNGIWYQFMLHSNRDGIFQGISYSEDFKQRNLIEEQLWISPGDNVHAFQSANFAFGSVFARFESRNDLSNFLKNKDRIISIEVV